jgi:hypothetical protein
MELLEGESLAVKLTAGPLPCAEGVQITLAVLAALRRCIAAAWCIAI